MNAKLRAAALVTLPLSTLLTGCAASGATPGAAPATTASRSTAPRTSVKPPAVGPSYPDVTQGDSATAALLYAFDAAAHSAVIEPVIFMEGPAFCRKYRIKMSEQRCQRDWELVQSHQKAAVPVSPEVELFTSLSEDKDCTGSIERGGSCPVTSAEFSSMAKSNKDDFLVHVTIKAGTVTRIAEEYRP